MEINNRTDSYASGYYQLPSPKNRQAINEIEQTRAQQERQRERTAAPEKSSSEDNPQRQSQLDAYYRASQTETYHNFYSQDVELDQATRQALETYRDVAMTDTDQHELMQRIDVLV